MDVREKKARFQGANLALGTELAWSTAPESVPRCRYRRGANRLSCPWRGGPSRSAACAWVQPRFKIPRARYRARYRGWDAVLRVPGSAPEAAVVHGALLVHVDDVEAVARALARVRDAEVVPLHRTPVSRTLAARR
eukprot:1292810-Rhodomonas_salina.3